MTITGIRLNYSIKDFFGGWQQVSADAFHIDEQTIIRAINKIVRDHRDSNFSAAIITYDTGAYDSISPSSFKGDFLSVVHHTSANSKDAPVDMKAGNVKKMLISSLV